MQLALRGVDKIYSTMSAFAAAAVVGMVMSWGDQKYGVTLGACRRHAEESKRSIPQDWPLL